MNAVFFSPSRIVTIGRNTFTELVRQKVFYFLLIRPQQKRANEHKAMLAKLAPGDEVATGGGIIGRITELSDAWDPARMDVCLLLAPLEALGSAHPEWDAAVIHEAAMGIMTKHLHAKTAPSPEESDHLVAFCLHGLNLQA